MAFNDVMLTIGFLIPVFSALMCTILILTVYIKQTELRKNKSIRILLFYYPTVAINWTFVLLHYYIIPLYVYVVPFIYAIFMLEFVFLYHFIFTLTQQSEKNKFSAFHYILPFLFAILLFTWPLIMSYDMWNFVVDARGILILKKVDSYSGYLYLVMFIKIIHSFVYMMLSLKRIRKFSKVLGDYSADEGRSPVYWLRLFYILTFAIIPISYAALYFSKESIWTFFSALIIMLVIGLQHLVICYNMLLGNYIQIIFDTNDLKYERKLKTRILKTDFEKYIQTNKPYLDPKLKITDLARNFGVNRTYLSYYINQEYGMNFSRYINKCRLRELNRMTFDPEYDKYTQYELISKAGFSNQRGYSRAQNIEGASRKK